MDNSGNVHMDFYLSQLNIEVDASNALVAGTSTLPFGADAIAAVDLPLENAMNIFQFNSGTNDLVNDIEDIKYKVVYSGTDPNNMEFDIDVSSTLISGQIYPSADKNSVTHDYVRFLSFKLFNTHLGVDLFSNESDVRINMKNNFSTAFDANMFQLDAQGVTDASGNSPSKSILLQIIDKNISRLDDIQRLAIGDNWFKSPLIVGDKLFFLLTVLSHPDQNDLTGVPEIQNRTYLIRATLI